MEDSHVARVMYVGWIVDLACIVMVCWVGDVIELAMH
jgi:hypothetical protein